MITRLQDWRIFEKKQKNAGIDIVICDVQEAFSKFFSETFVDDLKEFCEDYKRVFQIWDDTESNEPDYDFPNQVGTYKKTYGGELLPEDVELYFPEPMWQTVKDKLENIPDSGDMFEMMQGDMWVYIGGKHSWFICSEELVNLFKSFKEQQRTIILVGGASLECLEDIYVTMKALGVNVSIDPAHTYSWQKSKS